MQTQVWQIFALDKISNQMKIKSNFPASDTSRYNLESAIANEMFSKIKLYILQ